MISDGLGLEFDFWVVLELENKKKQLKKNLQPIFRLTLGLGPWVPKNPYKSDLSMIFNVFRFRIFFQFSLKKQFFHNLFKGGFILPPSL